MSCTFIRRAFLSALVVAGVGLYAGGAPPQLFAAPPTADYFVAPNGSDAGPGTKDRPFATPARAALAVRRLKAEQPGRARPITVMVRGGMYPLAQSLTLTPEDSGTEKAPVVYAAYPGESPVLSAGRTITGWREVSKGRWQVTLPEVASGNWNFSQLWVGDQRRFRASLPKNGYHFVEAGVGGTAVGAQDRFRFADGQIRADWKNLADVEVVAFHSWGTSRLPIRSVDAPRRIVTLGGGTWHASLAEIKPATWYRIENVGEALTEPDEWYLDRKAGVLTYLSRPGENPNKVAVVAPRLPRVLDLKGDVDAGTFVDYVKFQGLTFAHSNWNTPQQGHSIFQAEVNLDGAVTGRNARHITLQNCIVRHTGAHGVDFGAGCRNARIENSELFDLGAGGVKIGSGKFNEEADTRQWADSCAVRDTLVAHGGRIHPGSAGVWIGHAANNVVERNHIHDLYYCGLSVGWRWSTGPSPSHHNTIAYNHLHDLGQGVLSDLAGIYTLGEQPGTTLRFNRIHDVSRSRYGGWGIYFDESSGHILAEQNVVYRTEDAPFHLHHGRENTVRNNVFAFGKNAQIQLTNLQKSGTLRFESNLFFWSDGKLLQGEPDEEITFRNNLYWQTGATPSKIRFAKGVGVEDWRKSEPGVLIADPLFVDPSKGDFRLRAGSPATKVGFRPFDIASPGGVRRRIARMPFPLSREPFRPHRRKGRWSSGRISTR
jgi:hypothetical protein